jgi:hypothetical protein
MPNILHDKVFEFCEGYRAEHPEFRYWLRSHDPHGNKMDEGYWFQGNEKYAFVGLYNASGGPKRTRSIGLAFTRIGERVICKFEVAYSKNEKQNLINFYNKVISLVGGSIKAGTTRFDMDLPGNGGFAEATIFLNTVKPQIDTLVEQNGLKQLFITPEKFDTNLQRVLELRSQQHTMDEIKYIIANITWNSNDWQGISQDESGHGWVKEGNTPHESWNFDFDNPRNTEDHILGFCQFTRPPAVERNNNLIIFYSQGQIVGFYGKAEVLQEPVNINEQEDYNLVGSRPLCILLQNKIQDAKEKGYLEELKRIGQVGFSYLKDDKTINSIISEAIQLNPDHATQLNDLLVWLGLSDDEDEFTAVCKTIRQEDLEFYFHYLKNIIQTFGIPKEDARVVFSCKSKNLSFIVGARYCLSVKNNKGTIEFGFITTVKTKHHSEEFSGAPIASNYNTTSDSGHLNEFQDEIFKAIQVELNRTNKSRYLSSDNFRFREKAFSAISSLNNNVMNDSLNTILFGPPGTGKTYHTISEAVKIADIEFYNANAGNRAKLQERFNDLLINDWKEPKGQIVFCTFHQSFSYEDFVEGIKPLAPSDKDTFLKYKVEEGVFQKICRLAEATNNAQQLAKEKLVSLTQEEFSKSVFYKISLGDSTIDEDKAIYDYCISNNVISIGFASHIDFTGQDEAGVSKIISDAKKEPFSAQAINYFKNYLKTGNYVVVSYGNSYIRALGKVTGDYEYRPDAEIEYKHFRKVDWVFKNVEIPVAEFYQKNLSQQTIYKLKSEYIIPEFFVRRSKPVDSSIQQKKFVLVIDEINRGNVSSIFGELITLIEPTKRSGRPEAITVVLPYSKERFSVPDNIYIIGTMNTADRSIESLDTALRRRFSFIEMTSVPELIRTAGISKGSVEGIDLVQMLTRINERIEKLIDKDHKIGHSYFLNVSNTKDLRSVFKDKVIPLLEEYFFGDFGKIGLVLGNSFISKTDTADFDFADFADYDPQITLDLKQRYVYKITPEKDWDFNSIYTPKTKE